MAPGLADPPGESDAVGARRRRWMPIASMTTELPVRELDGVLDDDYARVLGLHRGLSSPISIVLS